MEIDKQNGPGHAALTWTCFLDVDMQHGHGHVVWIWTWDELLDFLVSAQSGIGMKKKNERMLELVW